MAGRATFIVTGSEKSNGATLVPRWAVASGKMLEVGGGGVGFVAHAIITSMHDAAQKTAMKHTKKMRAKKKGGSKRSGGVGEISGGGAFFFGGGSTFSSSSSS